jgi:glycerophosphoryl diester phosphodiesterase
MGNSRQAGQPNLYQKLSEALPWPKDALSLPLYQAHRGYHLSGLQENTLPAFLEAQKLGFEMIEMDIRLSADGIPVVFHDDFGPMTAQQLWEQNKAPQLEEVLSCTQLNVKLNLELKSQAIVQDALERKVFQIVEKLNLKSRVLFSSFNPFSLWRMSLYTKDIPLALLVSPDLENKLLKNMMTLPVLPFHLLHLEQSMISAELVSFWQNKSVPIVAWTVNEKQTAQQLIELGCASVITDTVFF